jgi:hypothetical protein
MGNATNKAKKPTLKLPDLTPKKDAKGGAGAKLWSEIPPLQIPPPGFITSDQDGK